MQDKLLKFIVCPRCQAKFKLRVSERDLGEVKTGQLICSHCRRRYEIKKFIPRFVSSDKYVANFSFEWQIHKKTQLDSFNQDKISLKTFIDKTGFNKKDLKNKLVLDVGCGMGRFMEIAANFQAEVIGIDLSLAVDAARDNLHQNKKCHFIQADIFNLPFKSCSFDAIYSIGVLHHTPDTKKAFMVLPPLLKPAGKIAIWVYGQNTFRPYDNYGHYWRFFTPHLPKILLYALSCLAVPLYWTYKVPFFGTLINQLIPYATNPDWRWRILDTFDWYSPKYQWKHTYPEIALWYEESGIKVIKILDYEASLLGVKS